MFCFLLFSIMQNIKTAPLNSKEAFMCLLNFISVLLHSLLLLYFRELILQV